MLKIEVTYIYSEVDAYLWTPGSVEEVTHLMQRYLEDETVTDIKIIKM